MKESQFIDDKTLRDNSVSHYEVLEKVKGLLLIPETELATIRMVADFYEVEEKAVSMNMKFHGREIDKFLCKKCFMKLYEMDEVKWNWWIETFKRDGCALFTDEEV